MNIVATSLNRSDCLKRTEKSEMVDDQKGAKGKVFVARLTDLHFCQRSTALTAFRPPILCLLKLGNEASLSLLFPPYSFECAIARQILEQQV